MSKVWLTKNISYYFGLIYWNGHLILQFVIYNVINDHHIGKNFREKYVFKFVMQLSLLWCILQSCIFIKIKNSRNDHRFNWVALM